MAAQVGKVDGATVRADFNNISTVIHYTRAAHFLGLWESERRLIDRLFPDKSARLLEAGCGAGRGAVGLWHLGYRDLTAFDFAEEMIDQAQNLAAEQGIGEGIRFFQADATKSIGLDAASFDGALFLFNGLMQIPGRANRRAALRELHRVCRPGAALLFTSHDRDDPKEAKAWSEEAARWARGEQNPRLVEFGDRYFVHEHGSTFMHLPDRAEVLADIVAAGWQFEHTALRDDLATERLAVREFSDNCRFWAARKR
jgi:ubiquinone/menaquinone biosynthesis C-methylase UbiE